MKGLFIVLEGIDGSGKGAIAKRLYAYLARKFGSGNVIRTAEPTNSLYGRQAKELQQSDESPDTNMERCLHLYVLDRVHHLANIIEPKIQAGKIVICERYKYSTLVYQSLQGIPFSHIVKLHSNMRAPDVAFVLDIDAGKAIKRIKKDKKRNNSFEKFEKPGFLRRARARFKQLPKLIPDERIIVVDADRKKEVVLKEIKQKMKEIYGF